MANKIKFTTLGIETESSEHSFIDLGYFSDLERMKRFAYIARYRTRKGIDEYIYSLDLNKVSKPWGNCERIETPLGKIWLIGYRKGEFEELNTFIRAHEETHVLHGIGKLGLLAGRMIIDGAKNILSISEDYEICAREIKEFAANIGGLFAVKNNRLDNPKLYEFLSRQNNAVAFNKSIEAFEDSYA